MGAQRYELPRWESVDLVRQQCVGRLCVIDHDYPIAIPVNYLLTGQDDELTVVVRTAPGTVLGRYEGLASLEIDEINLDNGQAWSVIIRGALSRVTGTHDLPDPQPLLSEGRHLWLTMPVAAISGRRFVVAQSADGFSVEWQLAST